jgi:hypothetical protein
LGVAIAASQVASGQANENAGQTGMHGFTLNAVKDFIYLEVHGIKPSIPFNCGRDSSDVYTKAPPDSKQPVAVKVND